MNSVVAPAGATKPLEFRKDVIFCVFLGVSLGERLLEYEHVRIVNSFFFIFNNTTQRHGQYRVDGNCESGKGRKQTTECHYPHAIHPWGGEAPQPFTDLGQGCAWGHLGSWAPRNGGEGKKRGQ